MLVDLVKKQQSKQSGYRVSVSSSLMGRGSITRIDFCWYPNWEFKKLDEKEKKELDDWRNTPAGEASMNKDHEEKIKNCKQAVVVVVCLFAGLQFLPWL